MVKKVDYRIHFALNCGAQSCPPIFFYTAESLEEQLNLATQSFLRSETDFDEKNKRVYLTALFKWFYADFGGRRGIRKIYKDQLGKDLRPYKIKFKKYDWSDHLDNFAS